MPFQVGDRVKVNGFSHAVLKNEHGQPTGHVSEFKVAKVIDHSETSPAAGVHYIVEHDGPNGLPVGEAYQEAALSEV